MSLKILVTGGAGFIGSHLCDRLLKEGLMVVCVDDLSLGKISNIRHNLKNPRFNFIKLDMVSQSKKYAGVFTKNKFDCVFHLAANSDIAKGAKFINVDFEKTFK